MGYNWEDTKYDLVWDGQSWYSVERNRCGGHKREYHKRFEFVVDFVLWAKEWNQSYRRKRHHVDIGNFKCYTMVKGDASLEQWKGVMFNGVQGKGKTKAEEDVGGGEQLDF